MIYSSLEHIRLYKNLSPRLANAIEFIMSSDLDSLAPGKHIVDAEDSYAMILEYETKPLEECEPETHKVYTDIQLMIRGEERFGFTALKNQSPAKPFLPDNDVAYYSIPEEDMNYMDLAPGEFVIFFPEDIHQPEIFIQGPMKVKKLVMKVRF